MYSQVGDLTMNGVRQLKNAINALRTAVAVIKKARTGEDKDLLYLYRMVLILFVILSGSILVTAGIILYQQGLINHGNQVIESQNLTIGKWAAAYNNSTVAYGKLSKNYSDLSRAYGNQSKELYDCRYSDSGRSDSEGVDSGGYNPPKTAQDSGYKIDLPEINLGDAGKTVAPVAQSFLGTVEKGWEVAKKRVTGS